MVISIGYGVSILLLLLLLVGTTDSKALLLPPRLRFIQQTVLSFRSLQLQQQATTTGYSIADIGCDHGLLSAALLPLPACKALHCVDISDTALSNARHLLQLQYHTQQELLSKVNIHLGDGLHPILANSEAMDIVVLSGMGLSVMQHILTATDSTVQSTLQHEEAVKQMQNILLNTLQTKLLVLQPWPLSIVDLLKTTLLLEEVGFCLQDMHISQPTAASSSAHRSRLFHCNLVFHSSLSIPSTQAQVSKGRNAERFISVWKQLIYENETLRAAKSTDEIATWKCYKQREAKIIEKRLLAKKRFDCVDKDAMLLDEVLLSLLLAPS